MAVALKWMAKFYGTMRKTLQPSTIDRVCENLLAIGIPNDSLRTTLERTQLLARDEDIEERVPRRCAWVRAYAALLERYGSSVALLYAFQGRHLHHGARRLRSAQCHRAGDLSV